jgi:hypothetical protein
MTLKMMYTSGLAGLGTVVLLLGIAAAVPSARPQTEPRLSDGQLEVRLGFSRSCLVHVAEVAMAHRSRALITFLQGSPSSSRHISFFLFESGFVHVLAGDADLSQLAGSVWQGLWQQPCRGAKPPRRLAKQPGSYQQAQQTGFELQDGC